MLAEKMTAEQARDWGLVYMVTEPERCSRRRSDVARQLATQPTRALRPHQARLQQVARHRSRRAARLRGRAAARGRPHRRTTPRACARFSRSESPCSKDARWRSISRPSSASSAPARWGRASRRSRRRPGIASCSRDAMRGATAEGAARTSAKAMEREVEKARLTSRRGGRADRRASTTSGSRSATISRRIADCGLVIEAIVEDLDVEAGALSATRRQSSRRDAVLATNTSSLSVASIASACAQSERVVGHPLLQSGAGDAARRSRAVARRRSAARRRRRTR